MRHQNILVIGGSGFIGRHVVHRLATHGRRPLVPARRRDRAKHLIVLPTVDVVDANVMDDTALAGLVARQDAVINLTGILHGRAADFARVHEQLPQRIAAACLAAGVKRLLHVSALGAALDGPSNYLRSKAAGEKAIQAAAARGLSTTIFRPSVVFGRDDRFLNLFADLARFLPVLPIASAATRMQPVWVEDVARAIFNALDEERTFGQVYELCGPRIYTLGELAGFAAEASGHPRRVVKVPEGLARLQAGLMSLLPEPMLSADNLDSLKLDCVASRQPYVAAAELGFTPTPMEPEAATYLAGSSLQARLTRMRTRAHR